MSENTSEDQTVQQVAAKAIANGGPATFEALRSKPRRTLKFNVYTVDADGEEVALGVKYQALSSKQYDDLVSEHPPSQKERAQGAVYNVDTFAPAIIAAVSVEPKLTVEQATELYKSQEWSGGEITSLFLQALKVCNAGLDVPFNARD